MNPNSKEFQQYMDNYVSDEEDDFLTSVLMPRHSHPHKKRNLSEVNDEDLTSLNMTELKEKCRLLGLKVTGNKAALLARLQAAKTMNDPVLKKKKTENDEISNKLREGLEHFFGTRALGKTPQYHQPEPKEVFDEEEWPEEGDRPIVFLDESVANKLQALTQADEIFALKGIMSMDPGMNIIRGKMAIPIAFPLTQAAENLINSMAEDAPFGLGSRTLVDLNVRRCRELTPNKFFLTNDLWRHMFSTSKTSKVLEEIRQELSPNNSEITAELYKFLYYPEGSFFHDHVDTQRDPLMFGTLVVELPSEYSGGQLAVLHNNQRIEFTNDKATTSAMWIAFYSSCTHSIAPITSGHRCALIYNLQRVGQHVDYPRTDWATKLVQEVDTAFEFAEEEDYGPNFTIGHMLDHKYAISHVVPTALKGIDAKVFHALKRSGMYDLLLCPIQIERRGIAGIGEETDSSEAEALVYEDYEGPLCSTYPVDPARPAHGGTHKQSYAAMTKQSLEANGVKWIEDDEHIKRLRKIARAINPTGNEGVSALLFYIHAALLIRRKKSSSAKSYPEGLAIPNPTLDYYVTNSTNNNRQDVDMAPSTDDPHKRSPTAGVVDVDINESISLAQRVKYLEGVVERLQQRVAELERARQR